MVFYSGHDKKRYTRHGVLPESHNPASHNDRFCAILLCTQNSANKMLHVPKRAG